MIFTVPLYARMIPGGKDKPSLCEVQPLFVPYHSEQAELLGQAVSRLGRSIRKTIMHAARIGDADKLAAWAFCPATEERRLTLPITLRRREAQCRFLIITYSVLDRKLAFTPSVPGVWFEILRGQSLKDRAAEVLSHHFREQEKLSDVPIPLENYSIPGKAFVATVDIDVALPRPEPHEKRKVTLAALFATEKMSGAVELSRTGECLNWLYPDDLDRAMERERELEELTRVLSGSDKRPVLLLGPRLSGKTALVHEFIFQKVARRKTIFAEQNNVWQLSPQRIIAGMSVVGQWESRILAIMDEVARRDHILYFDDFLGLYQAGVCASSSLSVAQVMKPRIEGRGFRLLAEMTPEAYRVLQEKDRGLADQFHIIRVSETEREKTLRIMIDALRQHEERLNCAFHIDALPSIIEVQDRYVHDASFPGKAARFARRLAVERCGKTIKREDVLEEFSTVSGFSTAFLDGRHKLTRDEILKGLERGVVGQKSAVNAVAQAICMAKAKMNDPDRPLGAFLFVGPTGVGKTQCAKAAASYLFGSAERLVRFDMNEFVDARSVARLVGTFEEPEGLLTSQIRRQPFCVLLLDEIEKAHPDVFDLLLQVLGEARLTDALGRTADFRNALIILTSNLGAREARTQLGFREEGADDTAVYSDVARQFFRPEFFNRLDKIVPFTRLTREETAAIARRIIWEVMGRHGLRQRSCSLTVDDSAINRLVDAGYDPHLGARALKRVVERQLAQPVATELAASAPGTPMVIKAYGGEMGIITSVQSLVNAGPLPKPHILQSSQDELLSAVDRFLKRSETTVYALKPEEPMVAGQLLPEHHGYVATLEQLNKVQRMRARVPKLSNSLRSAPVRPDVQSKLRFRRRKELGMMEWDGAGNMLQEIMATDSAITAIEEMMGHPVGRTQSREWDASALLQECALLEAMLRSGRPERTLLVFEDKQLSATIRMSFSNMLSSFYRILVDSVAGWKMKFVSIGNSSLCGLLLEGPGITKVLEGESGTHACKTEEEIAVTEMRIKTLCKDDEPDGALSWLQADRSEWIGRMCRGEVCAQDDPLAHGPVLRMYGYQYKASNISLMPEDIGTACDFRTGVVTRNWLKDHAARNMVLGTLALPDELRMEE